MILNKKIRFFLKFWTILFISYSANFIQALWSMWKFRKNVSASSPGTKLTEDLLSGPGLYYLFILAVTLLVVTKIKVNTFLTFIIFILIQTGEFFLIDMSIFSDRYAAWSTYDTYSIILETFFQSVVPIMICSILTMWPAWVNLKKIRN